MTNQISFQANYIKPSIITKCSKTNVQKDFVASFVELNPHVEADKNALRDVFYSWKKEKTFVPQIFDEFKEDEDWETTNKKYYALTQQEKDFSNPIADKILGLVEVITGDRNRLKVKYLQTNPTEKHGSKERTFKGIGTAILDSLKTIFSKEDLILKPAKDTDKFYEKNGFKKDGTGLIFKRS